MITNVRQWNPTAISRFAQRTLRTVKFNKSASKEESVATKREGFFDSYEKMLEAQAVLILGINNNRW